MMAGLTLAALTVPLNIGYAQIAGLPPEVGLYAAIIPGIGFALLSTSRHVVPSPDAVVAALVASSLAGLAVAGSEEYVVMAVAQAIVCGAVFGLMWIFKLGFLANFLSRAVLIGFLTGLGIEVFVSQIEKIMGVDVEADGFFRGVGYLVTHLNESNSWSVTVGLAAAAIVLLMRRLAPRWPGALVSLVVTTTAVTVLDLDERGVAVLGDVPSSLPSLAWPSLTLSEWGALVPGAVAIVGVTVAEGLLLARSLARKHGEQFDDDTELMSYGAANALAGVTGGLAIGSSASRTVTMESMGARTQLPVIVTSVVVAVCVAFFTGLLEILPEPALAAIVAVAVIGLVDVAGFRFLWRTRRSEFGVAGVCMLSVLVLGPLPAVFIAFALSTIDVLRRLSHPETAVLAPSPEGSSYVRTVDAMKPDGAATGVIVYRFGAPLQFANATAFFEETAALVERAGADFRALVLDMQAVSDIDSSGEEMLEEVAHLVGEAGGRVALARVSPAVLAQLEKYDLFPPLDRDLVFPTDRGAVAALA